MSELGTALQLGAPALLEALAEECTELAQAALKLARIERGENPTPVTRGLAFGNLTEEIADVSLCINVVSAKIHVPDFVVRKIYDEKLERWNKRMEAKQNDQ